MTVRAAAAREEADSARDSVERFRSGERASTPYDSRPTTGNGGGLSVAVLGGGVAGLAAAHRLARSAEGASPPFDVTVFESSHRFGGKVETVRRDGFVLESGPDSFVARKPAALELARELGLGDRLLETRDDHRRVLLRSAATAANDRLIPLPEGLAMIAPTRAWPFLATPLLSWRGKARATLDLVLPRRRETGDESVGAFLRRRLGPEMLEAVGGPLLAGIHGTDPDELSLHATFPALAELERRHGSLIRGLRAARREREAVTVHGQPSATSARLTFRDGMEELTRALTGALGRAGVALRPGCAVGELRPLPEGGWELHGEGFEPRVFDAVVLALPPHVAAGLVEGFDRRLAWEMRQARAASTATVSLAYRREDVAHPLDAYGFISQGGGARTVAACTFISTKFPHRAPEGTVLLRAFVGGPAATPAGTGDGDDALAHRADAELRSLLGITGAPVLTHVRRFAEGSPQYRVGHGERLASLEERLAQAGPGLAVAGCGFHGVGVPDCIDSGRRAADRLSSSRSHVALQRAGTGRRRAGGL
jgi:protoporphyrinogen/coproporphyrinogen III oxidase